MQIERSSWSIAESAGRHGGNQLVHRVGVATNSDQHTGLHVCLASARTRSHLTSAFLVFPLAFLGRISLVLGARATTQSRKRRPQPYAMAQFYAPGAPLVHASLLAPHTRIHTLLYTSLDSPTIQPFECFPDRGCLWHDLSKRFSLRLSDRRNPHASRCREKG